MSTRSLGTLSLDLIVQTGGFESGLDKAARVADNQTRKMEKLAHERARSIETAFSNMAKNIAGPLAAALGADTFVGMVKGLADAGDQLQKLSTKTGIAVEELSKLQYAASLSDLGTEDLGAALVKLNRVMGDAAAGSKTATEALARFGVAPDAGLSAIEVLGKMADRVKATGDETVIASGLNDVFGKSFANLIPLLKGGADGIKDAGDELERTGGVMSGDLAASSEAFNDNITRLSTKINALKVEILGPLIPLFLEISGAMTTASEKSDKLSWSGQALKTIFETMAVLGANVVYVFKAVGTELGGIAAQVVALAKFDFKGFSNIGAAMREDAEKARKDIDAFSARLLNPTKPASAPAPVSKGRGIVTLPVATATRRGGGGGGGSAVSEGQRLIEQLKDRLRATEHLTEVESLQERLADGRYKKVSIGEREIALGIAAQIDARKALVVELDAELAAVRVLTDEYLAQDARLKSLVSGTDTARNTQNMLDEALAESALLAGKIDTTTYDQIIEKLREVKDAGKETTDALEEFTKQAARNMQDAFSDFLFDPFKGGVKDMLQNFGTMLRKMIAQSVAADLNKRLFGKTAGGDGEGWLGAGLKWVSTLLNANGGVYASPSLSAYSGGVYDTPKAFAFAKGVGIFAEAGPEAIMPLSRGSDGKLGVKASSEGGPINITVHVNGNNNAPDVRRAAGQGAREALSLMNGARRYR